MRNEANRAMRASRDQVRKRTPIGRRIDPNTGNDLGPSGRLRNSVSGIRPRPTRPGHSYTTGAHSERREAGLVERGSPPHPIAARRAKTLRFWLGPGNIAFRKKVAHPGFDGYHMFSEGIAAALAEEMKGANTRLQLVLRW